MRNILLLFVMVLVVCSNQGKKAEKSSEEAKGTYMYILVKDYGEISINLFDKETPKNVSNIVKLVNQGFYNGLKFHRVIKGFVIQGGCPNGDGTGGPGYVVNDEISPNLKHLKGTVAMANRGPNTNGSQFYICLEPQPMLDGGYTVIGKVVKGIDVVDKIGGVKTTGKPQDRPLTDVIMEKVWIEEKK
jgi:peptidyl-prolyl cis-trans isomerase B (cyclophilin B)